MKKIGLRSLVTVIILPVLLLVVCCFNDKITEEEGNKWAE